MFQVLFPGRKQGSKLGKPKHACGTSLVKVFRILKLALGRGRSLNNSKKGRATVHLSDFKVETPPNGPAPGGTTSTSPKTAVATSFFKVYAFTIPANLPRLNLESTAKSGALTIFKFSKFCPPPPAAGPGLNFESSPNCGGPTYCQSFQSWAHGNHARTKL